jgi:hypothetical protein
MDVGNWWTYSSLLGRPAVPMKPCASVRTSSGLGVLLQQLPILDGWLGTDDVVVCWRSDCLAGIEGSCVCARVRRRFEREGDRLSLSIEFVLIHLYCGFSCLDITVQLSDRDVAI